MRMPMRPTDEADTRRGWGPWRREWYSICSAHRCFIADCTLCHSGGWHNCWGAAVSRAFFWLAPDLWRRLVNRKRGVL